MLRPPASSTTQAAALFCKLHTPTKALGSSVFAAIARPIADILAAIYSVIPNYAVAIIGLSLLWMLIIAPLTLKSTRSMLAMQKLQPEIKKLQAEHKNDRQALSQAQMDLFKQHNVSPFGSCLPMLLPLPVFFALFEVIDQLSSKRTYKTASGLIRCAQPHYLSPHTAMFKAIVAAGGRLDSFGLDLSKDALSSHASFAAALPYFVLLLVMIGTQYLQTARMMSRNPASQDNPQAKMMKFLPIIFGVIFIKFPAGVILYYTMSNVARVGQQELMYLFDPKVKSLARKDLKEVRDEVAEIERGTRKRVRAADTEPARPSTFRDLLARAKEQQGGARGNEPAGGPRSGSTKTAPAKTAPTKTATSRNGSSRTGTNGGTSTNGAPTRSGTKTVPAKNGAPTRREGNATSGTPAPQAKATPRAGAKRDQAGAKRDRPADAARADNAPKGTPPQDQPIPAGANNTSPRAGSRTGATTARPGDRQRGRRRQ